MQARPMRNNWPDGTFTEWTDFHLERFVRINPGYVVRAIVKERRDLTWSIASKGPDPIEDSGWIKSLDSNIHHYYK